MNQPHAAGMSITNIHQPIGTPRSVTARVARGILVTAPSLAVWLAAAAIHDLVAGALNLPDRDGAARSPRFGTFPAPKDASVELVAPQVRLAASVAVAEHHQATVDRGRARP